MKLKHLFPLLFLTGVATATWYKDGIKQGTSTTSSGTVTLADRYELVVDSSDWSGWSPGDGCTAANDATLIGFNLHGGTNDPSGSTNGWAVFTSLDTLQDKVFFSRIKVPQYATGFAATEPIKVQSLYSTAVESSDGSYTVFLRDKNAEELYFTEIQGAPVVLAYGDLPSAWQSTLPEELNVICVVSIKSGQTILLPQIWVKWQ